MRTMRHECRAAVGMALLLAAWACGPAWQVTADDRFQDLLRSPESVSLVTEAGRVELARDGDVWKGEGLEVTTILRDGGLEVELSAPGAAVKYLDLGWNGGLPADWKYLGDAWERSYGDLEWRPLDPAREMPWYFLASDGTMTHGYGVMTGPAAMCAWRAGPDGVRLTADVRCGGAGVRLGARRLRVCIVTTRRGQPGESPFAAARAFCRRMCPKPRLPKEPVYGFNDWYCDYGKNSAESVLYYAAFVSRLSPPRGNRPYMVVDDGWQAAGGGTGHGGPWDRGNARFPSMAGLAEGIRKAGARPGIWIHLLTAQDGQPASWRLKHNPAILDISLPEVRDYVKATVARLRAWGYELIKHDYSGNDLAGYTRAAPPDAAAWAYADRGRTAAELVLDHYRSIREAAGEDGLIIGCNTIGHLAAGLFELQRIGDDTSGRDWNRVRNRGVNALGFRASQHGAFFAVDADCVGLTEREAIPWACNSLWLDLLSRSGTPLFISFKRDALTPAQEAVVAAALERASRPQPLAEPLDWFDVTNPTSSLEAISHLEGGAAPRFWKLTGRAVEYDWSCGHS
jgi:alpha-galactosidase